MGKRVPASKQLFIMKKQGRSENTAKKIENGLYTKKYNFSEKSIAKAKPVVYTNPCCDIDSVEAKVAMHDIGFSWSECQLTITGDKSLYSITIWQCQR